MCEICDDAEKVFDEKIVPYWKARRELVKKAEDDYNAARKRLRAEFRKASENCKNKVLEVGD